jgi:hypothetical protein
MGLIIGWQLYMTLTGNVAFSLGCTNEIISNVQMNLITAACDTCDMLRCPLCGYSNYVVG